MVLGELEWTELIVLSLLVDTQIWLTWNMKRLKNIKKKTTLSIALHLLFFFTNVFHGEYLLNCSHPQRRFLFINHAQRRYIFLSIMAKLPKLSISRENCYYRTPIIDFVKMILETLALRFI